MLSTNGCNNIIMANLKEKNINNNIVGYSGKGLGIKWPTLTGSLGWHYVPGRGGIWKYLKVFRVVTIIGVQGDSFLLPFGEWDVKSLNVQNTFTQRITVSPKITIVSVVSWPPNVQVLITRAYEYVTLRDKRDPVDVIKDLEMGTVSWITQWTPYNHKCFYKRKIWLQKRSCDERDWNDVVTSQEMLASRCCRGQRTLSSWHLQKEPFLSTCWF